jgi:hypothetical protein
MARRRWRRVGEEPVRVGEGAREDGQRRWVPPQDTGRGVASADGVRRSGGGGGGSGVGGGILTSKRNAEFLCYCSV